MLLPVGLRRWLITECLLSLLRLLRARRMCGTGSGLRRQPLDKRASCIGCGPEGCLLVLVWWCRAGSRGRLRRIR